MIPEQENEILPADEGHEAFRQRLTPDDCPYDESDWRYGEWMFGWESSEQAEPDLFDHATGQFKVQK